MRFPLSLYLSLGWYILRKRWKGEKIFPLVLMLEPTHQCNLNCQGCGRIREYGNSQDAIMSLDECLEAVEESGAPVISICGGEPLLYPRISRLVSEIIQRGRHVHLCTNAYYLTSSLNKFNPDPRLNINIHLDGLAEIHDSLCGQKGVFDKAIQGIREAKRQGFRVITNTTIYKSTPPEEIGRLFSFLTDLGVDGFLLTPAYHWTSIEEDLFLEREEIFKVFRSLYPHIRKFKLLNSPEYIRFLQGKINLPCTPWGNITRDPFGWKSPCYLITDRHYPSYQELLIKTAWDKYRHRRDPRCRNCLMHSSVEATVALEKTKRLVQLLRPFSRNRPG